MLLLLLFLGWFFSVVIPCQGQVIFTEVMFYPDTLGSAAEFIEIYNSGTQPVDLSGWKVGDSRDLDNILPVDSNLVLFPHHFAIILNPGYFTHEHIYDNKIPDSTLRVTIEDSRFGAYGLANLKAVTLFLVNANGDTVQRYTYSPDNPPGISDEKIELVSSNDPSNWGNSRVFRGTPGYINSLTPRQFDLAITAVHPAQYYWSTLDSIEIRWTVVNQGKQEVSHFRSQIFEDQNGDSIPQSHEILEEQNWENILAPGDSLIIHSHLAPLPPGEHFLILSVDWEQDQDTSDNRFGLKIFVEEANVTMVINEIMFEPETGKAEWVELFNNGKVMANLQEYQFSDFKDTVTITRHPRIMEPGSYWILTGDSSFFSDYSVPFTENVIVIPHFPTLNNDVDQLTLMSPSGRIVDRVRYYHDWYGRSVVKGTSLEKINPDLPSQSSSSWAACVSSQGSTPGRQNSVFQPFETTTASVSIQPNPFSPDNDGKEDFLIIRLKSPQSPAFADVQIYDIEGRLIRYLAQNQPIGAQSQFVWDGKDDTGRTVRIGLYICLVHILDSSGNSLLKQKEVIAVARAR